MFRKLQYATFKLMDIFVILTMVLGSPLSISATALAQEPAPVLGIEKPDYAPGDSVHITGTGFATGDYILAANGPDGQLDWGMVTADGSGGFASDSPALGSAGTYALRAYASGWGGDWNEAPVASASFTVTAPAPDPTEEPTATEPPTATTEPTSEPTTAPTDTPTTEPTVAPTDTPTTEPTVAPTDIATSEPSATPTSEPTNTPTPSGPPTIVSDQADYPPGG